MNEEKWINAKEYMDEQKFQERLQKRLNYKSPEDKQWTVETILLTIFFVIAFIACNWK